MSIPYIPPVHINGMLLGTIVPYLYLNLVGRMSSYPLTLGSGWRDGIW